MTPAWEAEYDEMANNNPAFREIVERCEQAFRQWNLSAGERIVEIGGGTGGLSVRLARIFPLCTVIYLDYRPAMAAVAERIAAVEGLANFHVLNCDYRTANFVPESAAAIVSVHALSAIPNPADAVRTLAGWLKPGGRLFACDPVRRVSLLERILPGRRKNNLCFHDVAGFRQTFERAGLIVEDSFSCNHGCSDATLCRKPIP